MPESNSGVYQTDDMHHFFQYKKEENLNGHVYLFVFPEMKYLSNTEPLFKTADKYEIDSSERGKFILIYDIIKLSIIHFNELLRRHETAFWHGREYEIPTYEDSIHQIINSDNL